MPPLLALTPELESFIRAQHIFFVATAPLAHDGHINLSPKGLDTFRVLSPSRIAYLDFTGSGNETAAHATENGRITLMFCAFEGKPRILRLYGRAEAILPGSAAWAGVSPRFELFPGTRQIIAVEIERVASSCGFGVPLLTYAGERPDMVEWAEKKGIDGLREYRDKKNRVSIDGLPAPMA
jgi:hypothetical protein